MAYRNVYFLKAYSIPLALVVNNDKSKVHLVPTNGEKTWEPKGTKHVQVLGLENKRRVTMVVSSSDVGDMFTSSTFRALPPNNNGKTSCINND